jgi:hypothetical protein
MEIIKHEDLMPTIFKSKDIQDLNKEIYSLEIPKRLEAIEKIRVETTEQYPTMSNTPGGMAYLKSRDPEEVKKDFSIMNVGELDKETNVIKPGGISAAYMANVTANVEMNHWRGFWEQVNQANIDGILYPDFNYHLADRKSVV